MENRYSDHAAQKKAIIAKLKASGFSSRNPQKIKFEEEEESSDEEQEYNYEKLKTFHIPRKEQQNNEDILVNLPLHSREYNHTLYPIIKSSFFHLQSSRKVRINNAEMVYNPTLQTQFMEKKKAMKDDGRSDKELQECFGFVQSNKKHEVERFCRNGIEVGNTVLVSLGKATMGVYLSKHADVTSRVAFTNNTSGYIVVFKFIKGKTKVVTEFKGVSPTQEPTPHYDCHVTKPSNDSSKASHTRAYQTLQYYVYEYGDLDVLKRPRQILPYAVLHFTYYDVSNSVLQRDRSNIALNAMNDATEKVPSNITSSTNSSNFCLWEGKLLVKGGLFCSIMIKTDVHNAQNVAFLDKNLNVKSFLPLDQFAKQVPPTLLNKSGKKHNVIYRGHYYNIFVMSPINQSGFGKFRQLIAHLVQCEAVAVVPLRMSCCVYLLAKSLLTVDRMGLTPPSGEKSHYLHIVVVSPKSLTSRINDQKVYNLLNVRKRKDSQNDEKLPEDLEQRLRARNIDTNAAVNTMSTQEMLKLNNVLKEKKKFQISDKLLHHHYKDTEEVFNSVESRNLFCEKMENLWTSTQRSQLQPLPGMIQQSDVDSTLPSTAKSSLNNSANVLPPTFGLDVDDDAAFSAEEGSDDELRASLITSTSTFYNPRNNPKKVQGDKRKHPEVTGNQEDPPIKISRPSFKPLEEILCEDDNHASLLLHPDFVFTERFEKTHRVLKGSNYPSEIDIGQENQISVTFRQQVPFETLKDCPYACDGEARVKSMLRAIYGGWEGKEDSQDDREKVVWVRQVLHLKKKQSVDGVKDADSTKIQERKIVEDEAIKASSPLSTQGGSTDSGFASYSAAATPPADFPKSSLHNLASKLANAIGSSSADENTVVEDQKNIQNTTQNILQVLAQTVDGNGIELPPNLKEILNDVALQPQGGSNEQASDFPAASTNESMNMEDIQDSAKSFEQTRAITPPPVPPIAPFSTFKESNGNKMGQRRNCEISSNSFPSSPTGYRQYSKHVIEGYSNKSRSHEEKFHQRSDQRIIRANSDSSYTHDRRPPHVFHRYDSHPRDKGGSSPHRRSNHPINTPVRDDRWQKSSWREKQTPQARGRFSSSVAQQREERRRNSSDHYSPREERKRSFKDQWENSPYRR